MATNNMIPSTTIAMQEDAMWADYFAEQVERNARIPAEETIMWDQYHAEQQMSACPVVSEAEAHERDTYSTVLEAESIYGRFAITALGPAHLYPVDKPIIDPIYYGSAADKDKDKQRRTSKDRRYVHLVKAADRGKALGKTPGKKGKSYRQLKQEGIPLSSI
jgi:hypothetical protein